MFSRRLLDKHLEIRQMAFALFLCAGVLAASTQSTANARACQVNMKSPCQENQPEWFKDYKRLCKTECPGNQVPQTDPDTGDYWTTGCGGGKMIWETWVYCVSTEDTAPSPTASQSPVGH